KAFDKILPIFQYMGENIVLQGPAGAGQHTKAVNQIAIAPGMFGVCEALIYAKESGLDPTIVLSSIETRAAGSWSLSNYGARMSKGEFAPGFGIKQYKNDMKIAVESAKKMELKKTGLEMVLEMYEKVAAMDEMESGIHALLKYYSDQGL